MYEKNILFLFSEIQVRSSITNVRWLRPTFHVIRKLRISLQTNLHAIKRTTCLIFFLLFVFVKLQSICSLRSIVAAVDSTMSSCTPCIQIRFSLLCFPREFKMFWDLSFLRHACKLLDQQYISLANFSFAVLLPLSSVCFDGNERMLSPSCQSPQEFWSD